MKVSASVDLDKHLFIRQPRPYQVLNNRLEGFVVVAMSNHLPGSVEICHGFSVDNLHLKISHAVPLLLGKYLLLIVH
jgi:hypothetical protein